jgi:hypothetical protein
MYNMLTETYHSVTVSYVRKPRTVRIGSFNGNRAGRMRYSFSTVADAERFLEACGYAKERGWIESCGSTMLGSRPATSKSVLWTWQNGTDDRAHLDELTIVPVKKEIEMTKIQVQFYDHPVCSYTVTELGSGRELDVYTGSLRVAIEQFLGRYYSQHDRIFVDKLDGNTFAIYLKKPAHFA